MEIVFASSNKHKIKEINEIAKSYNIVFVSPSKGFNPIENGLTFEENSFIKALNAKEVEKEGRKYFLSDDSGLEIEALNNEPGIYSARYADTPEDRINKVLKNLENKDNRNARFVCAMTLLNEQGNILYKTVGVCRGKISFEQRGENGFGYDPIFIPDNYNVTIAELSEDVKNSISHRGKALNNVLSWLNNNKNLRNYPFTHN